MGRNKLYQRDQVIEQALSVFYQKGFNATSLSELTEVTGLNKKSLYNEFGSKEGLFHCALQCYIQSYAEQWLPIFNAQPLGLANIQSFFDMIAQNRVELRTGCLLSLSLNEVATISPDSLQLVQQAYQGIQQQFLHNLQQAEHNGEIVAGQSQRLATYLLTGFIGLTNFARLQPDEASFKQVIQQLLAGLHAPENPTNGG